MNKISATLLTLSVISSLLCAAYAPDWPSKLAWLAAAVLNAAALALP